MKKIFWRFSNIGRYCDGRPRSFLCDQRILFHLGLFAVFRTISADANGRFDLFWWKKFQNCRQLVGNAASIHIFSVSFTFFFGFSYFFRCFSHFFGVFLAFRNRFSLNLRKKTLALLSFMKMDRNLIYRNEINW